MPITRHSNAARTAAADATVDLVDVSGPGTLKLYTGAIPATPNTAATGTLLATIVLANPAFGASVDGVATAAAIASVNAVATGTAGYGRVGDGLDAPVIDLDVTATGGGGAIELSSVSVVSGGPVNITSFTYTQPL